MWGLPFLFFFSTRKAMLSQFRSVWWAVLPGYRVRLSPGMAEMADRRFAMDSGVNSRSGSEELALATVIHLTGKWSCHSWSWCVEPRSRHLHVAARLSFLHERVEERRHSLLHHLDKMGRGTRGTLKETGLIKMEGHVFWSDRELQIRKKWRNVGPRQEELDTMEMRLCLTDRFSWEGLKYLCQDSVVWGGRETEREMLEMLVLK